MFENWLLSSAWLAVVLGVLVYVANEYLAALETNGYFAGASRYLVFEERYVPLPANRQRWLNARLVLTALVLALGTLALWWVCTQQIQRPEVFLFILGSFVLLQVTNSLRRMQRMVLYHYARSPGNLKGKLEYSERMWMTQAAFDLYGFTGLYLFMFLLTGSWFFLGGALMCFVSGRRQHDWALIRK